jgi:tetratricopeptide (TPR) repeat protein
MNNNHLAGFLLMGALIAIGLAAREGGRSRRLWIAASVLCSIVLAWTLSRGAIGGLAFGLFALAAWLTGSKRTERRRGAIPVAIGSAAIAGAVVFAGLEPILRRFEMQGFDKLQTAVGALGLLEGSAWWLGVGRGAFSSAFVEREGSLARYTHPENLVVQWTTEWGVPIATVLLVVVVWALWKRIRTTDDPLVAAVCIAIFALSLQNLVDFSLEMAGVVAVVASLLGALIPASGDPSPRSSWRLALVSLGLFAVTLAALGPRVVRSDTQSIVDQLARSMQADDEAVFQATLRRGLALHPGEPALALLAGTYAGIKERRDAARWLSVVMEEAPGWAAPHAVAARWLFAEGRTDQALVEIREAEQRHAGSGLEVLCQILTGFPSMEHAERAAPSPELRVDYLARTASCPHLPAELRAEIDGAILRAEPTHRGALLRQSRRLVAQKQADDAVELLEDALQRHPSDGPLWVALIRTHLASGDGNQARRALQEARSSGVETRSLLEAQARVEAALGEADAMRSTTARLRGQARGDTGLIARSFMLEGELQASLGNIDEALAAYLAADEASPEAPALRRAAALALKSGRISQARRIYRTLCARTPESSACAQEARLAE